VICAYT